MDSAIVDWQILSFFSNFGITMIAFSRLRHGDPADSGLLSEPV